MFAQTVHSVAATVGFTSWLLLWSALVLGLAVRNGWASMRVRHSTVHAIHMTLALLGLTLGVVHGAAQLAAPNGIVRLVDLAVPFVNPSDPVGVGAGALSLELLLAGALSVPLRKRLGHARWRAVHALTYGAFILLTAHVLISGSDVGPDVAVGQRARRLPGRGRPVARVDRAGGRARARRASRSLDRGRAQTLAVDVDAGRCQRFGFCDTRPPTSSASRATAAWPTGHTCRPEGGSVIRAVEVCPASAISLRRLPTTVLTPDTGPIPRPRPRPACRARPRPRCARAGSRPAGRDRRRRLRDVPRVSRAAPHHHAPRREGSLTSTPATGVVVRRGQARRRVVVVGGGRAGVAAVEELLRLGYRRRARRAARREHTAVRPSVLRQGPPHRAQAARGRPDARARRRRRRLAARAPCDRPRPRSARRAHRHRRAVRLRPARRRHRSHAVPPAGWPMDEPGLHVLYRLERRLAAAPRTPRRPPRRRRGCRTHRVRGRPRRPVPRPRVRARRPPPARAGAAPRGPGRPPRHPRDRPGRRRAAHGPAGQRARPRPPWLGAAAGRRRRGAGRRRRDDDGRAP